MNNANCRFGAKPHFTNLLIIFSQHSLLPEAYWMVQTVDKSNNPFFEEKGGILIIEPGYFYCQRGLARPLLCPPKISLSLFFVVVFSIIDYSYLFCLLCQALALGEDRVIPGIKAGEEASLPGRKTVETERAAERIMEAVEVHKEVSQQLAEYRDKLDQHKQSGKDVSQTPVAPQTHPLMVAYDTTDPDRYLLKVLRQVKSSEVEEALLVLPFHYVCSLLTLLDQLLQKGWETELVMRILLFIVRVHHGPLSNTPSLLSILNRLQSVARKRVDEVRDRIGFNLAGLQYLQRELEEREAVQLFADASDRVKQKRKQRRNKDKAKQRAILTL